MEQASKFMKCMALVYAGYDEFIIIISVLALQSSAILRHIVKLFRLLYFPVKHFHLLIFLLIFFLGRLIWLRCICVFGERVLAYVYAYLFYF